MNEKIKNLLSKLNKNEKIKNLLSKLNWWQKIIVIIALAVIVYFANGCGFKSFYHADNVTHDIGIEIDSFKE